MFLRQELQGSHHAVIGNNPAPDDQGECISYIYIPKDPIMGYLPPRKNILYSRSFKEHVLFTCLVFGMVPRM